LPDGRLSLEVLAMRDDYYAAKNGGGMTRTVDISGMDPSRKQYGYEWGCQVLMFRALHWLKKHEAEDPKFHTFKNVTGLLMPDNDAAKAMEAFALDHEKIREFGATGAMVQYALIHALQRFRLGEEKYFAEFGDDPDRVFEFDESEAVSTSTIN
jgi:hypothetical protein